MGLEYIDTRLEERPLCPRAIAYGAAEHRIATDILNALYEKLKPAEPDADMTPENSAIYRAAQDAAPDHMRLYRISGSPTIGGRGSHHMPADAVLEGWYFDCRTCGHTIPAVARQLPTR